jgi:hypothetical protein
MHALVAGCASACALPSRCALHAWSQGAALLLRAAHSWTRTTCTTAAPRGGPIPHAAVPTRPPTHSLSRICSPPPRSRRGQQNRGSQVRGHPLPGAHAGGGRSAGGAGGSGRCACQPGGQQQRGAESHCQCGWVLEEEEGGGKRREGGEGESRAGRGLWRGDSRRRALPAPLVQPAPAQRLAWHGLACSNTRCTAQQPPTSPPLLASPPHPTPCRRHPPPCGSAALRHAGRQAARRASHSQLGCGLGVPKCPLSAAVACLGLGEILPVSEAAVRIAAAAAEACRHPSTLPSAHRRAFAPGCPLPSPPNRSRPRHSEQAAHC